MTKAGSPLFELLQRSYLTVDKRILGAFRIYFGGVLLYDLLRRVPYISLLYSNDGVLPNHVVLWAPQAEPQLSLYLAFSKPTEVGVAFGLTALVYVLYTLGCFTRVMQVLALLCVTGLNNRNLFLEDGGTVTTSLLACFTLLLPLGERYSVDAVRRRFRERRDPAVDARREDEPGVVSLWVLAILLQASVIYLLNALQKRGATWRQGEAVHWVLWQSRVATSLAVWLRMHEPSWFSPLTTWGALVAEGLMAPLLLSPFRQRVTRSVALLIALGLHLGIAAMMTLGPFSYAMIGLVFLLSPAENLGWLGERLGLDARLTATVRYERRHPGARLIARLLSAFDAHGRISFEQASDGSPALAARIDGGVWAQGADGVAEAGRALPVVGRPLVMMASSALGRAMVERWLRWPVSRQAPSAAPRRGRGLLGELAHDGRELAAVVFMSALAIQLTSENPIIAPWARLAMPAALRPLVMYPRVLQGWTMFAPDVSKQEGLLVVDAVMANGRHIDPFTGQVPSELLAMQGAVPQGAPLCDYFFGIQLSSNGRYRPALRRYLEGWQQRTGRPEDEKIVSYHVYWVSHDSPPPGVRAPDPSTLRKRLVMSSEPGREKGSD